ncbi:MAG: C40 family peptidase [Gemmatimonadales bacterium]|nr:C40 family peptidase [Gemmatimonadales bacterium]
MVISGRLSGVLGYGLLGSLFRDRGRLDERLWGLGADLTLFRGGQAGPYVVAGLTGGIGTGKAADLWGSWSAGLGYEVYPLSFLTAALEGRWRDLSPGSRSGIELGLRLGLRWGGGPRPPPSGGGSEPQAVPPPRIPDSPLPSGEDPLAVPRDLEPRTGAFTPPGQTVPLLEAVVQTATQVMGTPYKWGGTGEDGFDCSGLIQYAYGEHGIRLPRRSADQAQSGQPVERLVTSLRPGDILTFSTREGPVTHVGLYVGDGQFIHSASQGVQLSRLSNDDPYGRWWWERWVGARRVVD